MQRIKIRVVGDPASVAEAEAYGFLEQSDRLFGFAARRINARHVVKHCGIAGTDRERLIGPVFCFGRFTKPRQCGAAHVKCAWVDGIQLEPFSCYLDVSTVGTLCISSS